MSIKAAYNLLDSAVHFLMNDWEVVDQNRNFKPDKKPPDRDERDNVYAALELDSIIKKTKKEYYTLAWFDIIKTSFTGQRESIYSLSGNEYFIAKKRNRPLYCHES